MVAWGCAMGIAEAACISSLTVTTSLVKSARSNVLNSALMAMATISSRLSQFQSWSWNAWLRLKACPCCSGVGCWGCKAKCKFWWISVRFYSEFLKWSFYYKVFDVLLVNKVLFMKFHTNFTWTLQLCYDFFLANSYFILQISHAKTFKIMLTRCEFCMKFYE